MVSKKIVIWNAPLKKNIAYQVNSKNFQNDKDFLDHIQMLRDKHKKENAEYRTRIKEERIIFHEQIRGKKPIELAAIVEKEIKKHSEIPSNYSFNSIPILSDIDLKLDKNTGNSTVLFGSGKRGKTTLMMHLYEKYYVPDKDFITTLFSINSHIQAYKTDSKLLRCDTFNDKSEKFIRLEKYINSKTKNKYKFLNMFDDCIDMKYSGLVNQMVLTYRNSLLSTIMCLQYTYLMSKMNRANVNNIIIFGCNSYEAACDLIKTFLRPYFIKMNVKTEPQQVELFKYVTDNHGFFYIHNATDNISFHRLKI